MDFKIDLSEQFPRLPRAPIVESVIQWQAKPTRAIEEKQLQEELEARFPDFVIRPQHRVEASIQVSTEGTQTHQQRIWEGYRLTSDDQKFVCQFKRDTVAFSRLAPYEGWEAFETAARTFWRAFQEIASPVAVARIGVRFISQVPLRVAEQVAEYVGQNPEPLERIELASESFFYQNSILIPGHPYRLNLVRTIQDSNAAMNRKSLVVDIDVTTTDETSLEEVEHRLQEMRFIKNKIFFSYMKDAKTKFS